MSNRIVLAGDLRLGDVIVLRGREWTVSRVRQRQTNSAGQQVRAIVWGPGADIECEVYLVLRGASNPDERFTTSLDMFERVTRVKYGRATG